MKSEITKALKKYQKIQEKMRRQEDESRRDDPDDIGLGCDEDFYQQLSDAKQKFNQLVGPEYFSELIEENGNLKDDVGQLILENVALKIEVKRLGGDPDFIGNISSEGGRQ